MGFDSVKKSESIFKDETRSIDVLYVKFNTGFYGSFPNLSSNLPLPVLVPFYPALCLQKRLMTI